MSARYGVIGWPVAHSRSPLIHNYWLHEVGIDAVYEAVAVPPEADFRAKLEELRGRGLPASTSPFPIKKPPMPRSTRMMRRPPIWAQLTQFCSRAAK